MGFLSNLGKAVTKAVNDTLGTNISIGSSTTVTTAPPPTKPPLPAGLNLAALEDYIRPRLTNLMAVNAINPTTANVLSMTYLRSNEGKSMLLNLFNSLKGEQNNLAHYVNMCSYESIKPILAIALNDASVTFGGSVIFSQVPTTVSPPRTTTPTPTTSNPNSIGNVLGGILNTAVGSISNGVKTAVKDAENAFVSGVNTAVAGTITGAVNTGLDAVFNGNQNTSITDKAGNILSKILDSALVQWFKRNWFWVLLPFSVLAVIYFYRKNAKNRKSTKKRRY